MNALAPFLFGILFTPTSATQTTAGAQPEPNFIDWVNPIKGSPMHSKIAFTMRNLSNREYLAWGTRTWGINLVWKGDPKFNNVFFAKPDPGKADPAFGPIGYATPTAVYIANGGYLKYESRSVGVNLGWSTKPAYEWYVVGLAEQGSQVLATQTFGLLNEKTKDFLIYKERSAGINLGWAKDDKSASWYAEGRRFQNMLRARGHLKMVAFLRQKVGW